MEALYKVLLEAAPQIGISQIYEVSMLISKWHEIVGDQVARNTCPANIKGEKLLVITVASTWSHQLSMLKPQIIKKLRKAGFEISEIIFTASMKISADDTERKAEIIAPPDYSRVSDNEKTELRKAIASYMGARKAIHRSKQKSSSRI